MKKFWKIKIFHCIFMIHASLNLFYLRGTYQSCLNKLILICSIFVLTIFWMLPCVSLLLSTIPMLKQNPEWQTPLHKGSIGIPWAEQSDKPQGHLELTVSYSNCRWLFSGWKNYRTEAALPKGFRYSLTSRSSDSETYIPSKAQEDVTNLCIDFSYLYLSHLIFLSPPKPSSIQPSHIPHATLACPRWSSVNSLANISLLGTQADRCSTLLMQYFPFH